MDEDSLGKMQSFSFLEEKTLFVSAHQGENSPTLIGATKGFNQSIIYPAAAATEQEIQKFKVKVNPKNINLLTSVKDFKGENIKIITNLKGWAIANSTTKAIQITNNTKQQTIKLIDSLTTNISEEEEITVEGYLACHRGKGVFTITVNSENYKTTFNTKHTGGSDQTNYQHLSIPIKIKPGTLTISASIEHFKTTEEGSKDCFYFVGDLSLIRKDTKSLITPRIKGKIPTNKDAKFYKLCIEKFLPGNKSPLYLEWSNGQREEIFAPVKQSASFIENYNHTFKIKSEETGVTICLFIGNQFAKSFSSEEQEFFITLPPAFLNGEPALASLTDESGSQILDEIVIQPPRSMVPEDILIEEGKKTFPTDYSLRNSHRLESIKQNFTSSTNKNINSLRIAIRNLELNYKTLKLEPIAFPENTGDIKASIIIPAHNKVETTYYCLCSLLLSFNHNNSEIIVVDDGSTDETQELERIIKGITVIHNKKPLRFIDACNKGASVAKGEFVVLLNNDTEVTSGWLDSLIQGFHRFDQVGLVGSRLLYPDGRLQDAGGIIWKSGDPWNYGNGQNPWDPRYSYARQVDYLSGAALMTTKKIWDEIGGLSNYLKPMYFEDTDLSFKIRNAGYKTYYIPDSIIYHFEGVTSGTDTSKGFKKYQEINRPKFKKHWSHAFCNHSPVGTKPDLEKDRNIVGRVLFIDYQIPRGDRDAGSYALLQEIKLIQSLGFKATFIPQNLANLGQYKSNLEADGVEVICAPFYMSVEKFLEARGSEFTAIYLTRYTTLQACIHSIKTNCSDAKIILNNCDLHFLRELRKAAINKDAELLEIAKNTQKAELEAMKQADLVLTYSEAEESIIFSHSNCDIKIMKCD